MNTKSIIEVVIALIVILGLFDLSPITDFIKDILKKNKNKRVP